jgi:hypothetical protein
MKLFGARMTQSLLWQSKDLSVGLLEHIEVLKKEEIIPLVANGPAASYLKRLDK